MAPPDSTVSIKYFCCICDEYFQTVSSLHKHQTYMHSTEELSKAVLSLTGLELPTEYKTSEKLIAELYPLTNSLTKCKGFALNNYSKRIESTSEIIATSGSASSERPKHYNHVKVIGTENKSYNSTSKNNKKGNFEVLNNTDLNRLKTGILFESFKEQEYTDYHEKMLNETTEFDEDPYWIDFEDYFIKYSKSSWHMSGNEKQCVKEIMKSQSPNLKTTSSVAKSERITNGTKDIIVSEPSSSIKSSNDAEVKIYDTQIADTKLLDASVSDLYSLPENSKENLKRCGKRKVSRPLMQLLPRNTLQQSPAFKTSVKSKTSVKPKLNNKMAIIPVSNTSESSFPNLNNTKNKKLLLETLKCSDSLSCPPVILQENVTDKCMTKSVKNYHPRQKSSLFRRKKVTETKNMHKVTTGMPDKKIVRKSSMSRLTNNMLPEKSLTNSSEPSFLMNINSLKHFFCEQCKRGYTRKYHVERHLRMHTGERPFSCSHCDKQFTVRSVLEQHIRRHTGEKPYSCKICQLQFPQKSGLMTHMMLHTGKPFKCNLCRKAFVSNYKLMKHLHSHHS